MPAVDGVVAGRDLACEPVGHPARFSFPCRFAYRSPTLEDREADRRREDRDDQQRPDVAHCSPAPLTIDARQPRSAYVAGEIFAIHCIHSGITLTG